MYICIYLHLSSYLSRTVRKQSENPVERLPSQSLDEKIHTTTHKKCLGMLSHQDARI